MYGMYAIMRVVTFCEIGIISSGSSFPRRAATLYYAVQVQETRSMPRLLSKAVVGNQNTLTMEARRMRGTPKLIATRIGYLAGRIFFHDMTGRRATPFSFNKGFSMITLFMISVRDNTSAHNYY
jgi:hypothetical protein